MDYLDKNLDTDPGKILEAVIAYKTLSSRAKMMDNYQYFKGNNTFIENLRKYFYSDKYKRIIENTYVSNYKSPYGAFHDIVSQKVSTILNEAPIISSKAGKKTPIMEEQIVDELGYALKKAGTYASIEGESYIYQDYKGKHTVIRRSQAIAYYDDETNELKALIRFWDIQSMDGTEHKTMIERYSPTGLTRYEAIDNSIKEVMAETPYQFRIRTSALTEEIETVDIGILPIVRVQNDEDSLSDMTSSVKHKIDAIDLINSGFLNNIEDFSEAFWVIKNGSGMNSDEFEDFVAYINQTRKMIVNGDDNNSVSAEPKQLEIPTNARTTFVEERKKELVLETGIIDTASLTGSSLTTTAIKAAALRLKQRATDFEWFIHEAAKRLVHIYQAYNGQVDNEFTIDFTFMLIENETELITNANSIKPNVSQYTYLNILKRAGYIDSVEEEIKRLEDESNERLQDIDIKSLFNQDNNGDDNPTDPNKQEPPIDTTNKEE